jgi:hypothetical protein
LHRTGATAQIEHLPEEFAQRLQMPAAKLVDRAEVGLLQRRQRHDVHVLLTAASTAA